MSKIWNKNESHKKCKQHKNRRNDFGLPRFHSNDDESSSKKNVFKMKIVNVKLT